MPPAADLNNLLNWGLTKPVRKLAACSPAYYGLQFPGKSHQQIAWPFSRELVGLQPGAIQFGVSGKVGLANHLIVPFTRVVTLGTLR